MLIQPLLKTVMQIIKLLGKYFKFLTLFNFFLILKNIFLALVYLQNYFDVRWHVSPKVGVEVEGRRGGRKHSMNIKHYKSLVFLKSYLWTHVTFESDFSYLHCLKDKCIIKALRSFLQLYCSLIAKWIQIHSI